MLVAFTTFNLLVSTAFSRELDENRQQKAISDRYDFDSLYETLEDGTEVVRIEKATREGKSSQGKHLGEQLSDSEEIGER